MDTKEQRQKFEAWCNQWNIAQVFPLDSEGRYKEYSIHLMYCAWLQGQASSIPEGYVVVPKEPTEAMIDAGDGEQDYTFVPVDIIYKAMIEAVEKNDE